MKKKIFTLFISLTVCLSVLAICEMGSVSASAEGYKCTNPKLQQLIEKWEGVYWTSSFRGSTTCKGFANMMFHELYGNGGIGAYNSGRHSYYIPSPCAAVEIAKNSSASRQDFYDIMHKAASGDFIQWATAYSQHSSIFLSCDENGFYVFDSNYVRSYLCAVHYLTYDYISSVTYGVSVYRSTSSESYVKPKPKTVPFEFAEKSIELSYMETNEPYVNGNEKIVSWTSSNDSVAVVNQSGIVEGVSDGTAVITATSSDGKATQMTVTVKNSSIKRVLDTLINGLEPMSIPELFI